MNSEHSEGVQPVPGPEGPIPQVMQHALALLSSIRKSLEEQTLPPPDALFHYTDVEGLHGILGRGDLWASNAAYLNDRTELSHTLLLLKAKLEEGSPSHAEQSKESTGINNGDRVMRLVLDNFHNIMDAYIVCFCEVRDLLSQWRGYSQSSGYALGFSSDNLLQLRAGRLSLIPVVYDESEQHRLINELADNWREICDQSEWGPEPFTTNVLSLAFAEALSLLAVSFKHHTFSEEREWRLVHRRSQIIPDDGLNLEVLFRTRRGMLLPYESIGFPIHPMLPLQEILIGPTPYPDQAGYALERYLVSLGYVRGTVPVSISQVPLR